MAPSMKKHCKIKGCNKPTIALGLCTTHYWQQKRAAKKASITNGHARYIVLDMTTNTVTTVSANSEPILSALLNKGV